MANRIRIDEDGTIIRENIIPVPHTEIRSSDAFEVTQISIDDGTNGVDMSGAIAMPRKWWQKPGFYWIITMIISAGISYIAFVYIVPVIFAPGNPDGFFESIINFFMIVSPYIILASGIIGQIIYNRKIANKFDRGYTPKDYILSPFIASGSIVIVGAAMFLMTLMTTLIIGLFTIIFGIAVVLSIFSS